MKKTKVYVDDETLMKCERYRHNNCPIIQTHDRELVKEVCEKIKVNCEETYIISLSINKPKRKVFIIFEETLKKIEKGEQIE